MKTMRARILEAIKSGCHLTNNIVEFCGLELQYNEVCAILAELQIEGKVEYVSGGGYYLTKPVRKRKNLFKEVENSIKARKATEELRQSADIIYSNVNQGANIDSERVQLYIGKIEKSIEILKQIYL